MVHVVFSVGEAEFPTSIKYSNIMYTQLPRLLALVNETQ